MIFFLFCVVVAVSFCIEAIVGFGASVLIIALGANLYPIEVILPLFIPVNWVLSLYFTVRSLRSIDWRFVLGRVLAFMGAGFVLGFLWSAQLSGSALKILFSLFVLSLSSIELWRSYQKKAEQGPLSFGAEAIWLFFAGVVYGVYTTGGPMVVYCASRRVSDKSVLRGTLSSVWLLMSTAMIIGKVSDHSINPNTLQQSAALLLPLLLGIYAGEAGHKRLSGDQFKRLVYLTLWCAALFLLFSTLYR